MPAMGYTLCSSGKIHSYSDLFCLPSSDIYVHIFFHFFLMPNDNEINVNIIVSMLAYVVLEQNLWTYASMAGWDGLLL